MRHVWFLLVFAVFASGQVQNVSPRERAFNPPGEKMWKISLVSLAGASVLDATSSWGKCEANSFLAGTNGRFDGRSVALKSAAIGGLAVFEHFTGKKHPQLYRLFSATNFAVSGGLAGMAARNYAVGTPGAGYSCR